MRGMSCLLTGIELFPGNIQGGSDTPAGWASGPSIDQELRQFLQGAPTRTRWILELGVAVPNRADPWTRWTYAGPNNPSPRERSYQVFERLYGQLEDRRRSAASSTMSAMTHASRPTSPEDRELLERLPRSSASSSGTRTRRRVRAEPRGAPPRPGAGTDNDDMPRVSAMQADLLVNAFANDMARVASLQYTSSVGQARLRWLGIDEGHHSLSHDPDLNEGSQEKLVKINVWFANSWPPWPVSSTACPNPAATAPAGSHDDSLDQRTGQRQQPHPRQHPLRPRRRRP
jgi:hypothetical protein